MKIILTPQESEEYFFNALCNGLGYVCSGYDLELKYSKNNYKSAVASLEALKPDEVISYEDVLMQILRLGGALNLYDHNDELDNVIVLEDVHERVATTQLNHLMDMIEERDDAITADVIIQTVFLGEAIYG
jgi:hypothetical protein